MLVCKVTLFRIQVRRWLGWLGWMVSNGHVMLDGIMFAHFFFSQFAVTILFVSAKAYVCPYILDYVAINVVVKEGVF